MSAFGKGFGGALGVLFALGLILLVGVGGCLVGCPLLIHSMAKLTPARGPAAETKAREAVAYLSDGSVPEIAWVEVEENDVYVGFRSLPDDWRAVLNGAALAGNRATGYGCHVWAVGAEQRGWRPGAGPYYGETTARDGRIE